MKNIIKRKTVEQLSNIYQNIHNCDKKSSYSFVEKHLKEMNVKLNNIKNITNEEKQMFFSAFEKYIIHKGTFQILNHNKITDTLHFISHHFSKETSISSMMLFLETSLPFFKNKTILSRDCFLIRILRKHPTDFNLTLFLKSVIDFQLKHKIFKTKEEYKYEDGIIPEFKEILNLIVLNVEDEYKLTLDFEYIVSESFYTDFFFKTILIKLNSNAVYQKNSYDNLLFLKFSIVKLLNQYLFLCLNHWKNIKEYFQSNKSMIVNYSQKNMIINLEKFGLNSPEYELALKNFNNLNKIK